MDRRSLLLGLLFAPFAAVAKPAERLSKPVVYGRVIKASELRFVPGQIYYLGRTVTVDCQALISTKL